MSELTVQHFISPSFTHDKLESPSFADLIDIFEDRIRNWFFLPISVLLDKPPNCDIAAVALMVNYFESIEIYFTGEDSKRSSAEFFARGFGRVFTVETQEPNLQTQIAEAMYQQLRCGFSHDGMFRNRVFFSRSGQKPILVTWPKKNGVFDLSGEVKSIMINPTLFFDSIKFHFDGYVKKLRNNPEAAVKLAFENAVKLKWGLDEPDPYIGMTQDEFFKK